MQYREALFSKIFFLCTILYCLISLFSVIYYSLYHSDYYLLLSLASFLFLLAPPLFIHLLHLKKSSQLSFFILLFCFVSFTLGMVFKGYANWHHFDKLVHTFSGLFFAWLGVFFFYCLKGKKKIETSDYSLVSWFSFLFSLSVAAVWEIYEYILSLLLKTDPQNVLTTGVTDTMLDMIVCLMGALLFEISIYYYYRKHKVSFLMGIFQFQLQ